MTRPITYRTTDVDSMAAVYEHIGELPDLVQISTGVTEARFTSPDAPEAARRFRNDNRLQNFISAKKTIFRLLQGRTGRV